MREAPFARDHHDCLQAWRPLDMSSPRASIEH
jgi:hypothetical protein